MSLRDALKSTVARCTPLEMQHATFQPNDATGDATSMQQRTVNPHGIGVSHATSYATAVQQDAATHATRGDSGEKLHVAFASTCNTQPGALTAHRLTANLLKAAARRCDYFGDSPEAREQMRRDCLATPLHLQSDLLDHFNEVNQESKS